MKLEPHKAQIVIYRAIAGDEYAAIITNVEPGGLVCLATFMPSISLPTTITRAKYFDRAASVPEGHKGPACYPPI